MRVSLHSLQVAVGSQLQRFHRNASFVGFCNLNNHDKILHLNCGSSSNSDFQLRTFPKLRNIENPSVRAYSSHIPNDVESKFKKEQNRLLTIPNLLCCSRIIASPILCYYILNSNYDLALGILLTAAFTDFADGQIARRFPSQASKIGTFLDPLADKVLVVSLFLTLTYTEAVPGTLTILIVFRDVLLLAAGSYIRYLSLPPPKTLKSFFDRSHSSAELKPTYLSKVNTVIQLLTAAISLYAPNIPSLPHSVLEALWYTAGFSTILSGLSYAVLRRKTYSISHKRE